MWWLEHLNASPNEPPRGRLGSGRLSWGRRRCPRGKIGFARHLRAHRSSSRAARVRGRPAVMSFLAIDVAGKAARPTHYEELAKITE